MLTTKMQHIEHERRMEKGGKTHSVRMILLPSGTCSAFRWLMPLPLVFLPPSVSPFPLKLSHWSPPLLSAVELLLVPANPPLNDEPGLEDPGECEFRSIFSFDAIVVGGAALGLSGSTYPRGAAKSTSRSVSRTLIPSPPGRVSITSSPNTMEL